MNYNLLKRQFLLSIKIYCSVSSYYYNLLKRQFLLLTTIYLSVSYCVGLCKEKSHPEEY